MATTIETLVVKLIGQGSSLERTLQQSTKTTDKFVSQIKKAGIALGAAFASRKVINGIQNLITSTATLGDSIQKMSVRTGASAEFLSTMGFVAEQSGSSLTTFSGGINRLNRRIANAATATGPAVRALDELGISAKKLDALTTEQKFFSIQTALNEVVSPARKAQLAFELFGDQATELIPLLNLTTQETRAMQDEAVRLGRQMSGENVEAAAAFNDEINRLTSVLEGFKFQLGASLLPTLTEVAETMREIVDLFRNWEETVVAVGFGLGRFGLAFNELLGFDVEAQRAALDRGVEIRMRPFEERRRRRREAAPLPDVQAEPGIQQAERMAAEFGARAAIAALGPVAAGAARTAQAITRTPEVEQAVDRSFGRVEATRVGSVESIARLQAQAGLLAGGPSGADPKEDTRNLANISVSARQAVDRLDVLVERLEVAAF